MYVKVGNYRFYLGNDEIDCDKPSILFLHGFMGSGRDWNTVTESFKNKFNCLTIDLPGHGNSAVYGSKKNFQTERVAQGLIDLLNKLKITQCNLVGYSMGGRLGFYLLINYPAIFKKGIIESATLGIAEKEDRYNRRLSDQFLAEKLKNNNYEQFVNEWYKQPLFRSIKKHLHFPQLLKRRLQNNPVELAKSISMMGTGTQPSLWEQIKDENLSIRFLAGELDTKYCVIGQQIKDLNNDIELIYVEGAGHNIHFEQPDIFKKIVDNFLIPY